jgi:hypothetical protein
VDHPKGHQLAHKLFPVADAYHVSFSLRSTLQNAGITKSKVVVRPLDSEQLLTGLVWRTPSYKLPSKFGGDVYISLQDVYKE